MKIAMIVNNVEERANSRPAETTATSTYLTLGAVEFIELVQKGGAAKIGDIVIAYWGRPQHKVGDKINWEI